MAKKDRYSDDLKEEFTIENDDEDMVEDMLDSILVQNTKSLQELVEQRMGKYIEEGVIDQLVDAYNIDVTDEDLAPKQVYNVYMKEFDK